MAAQLDTGMDRAAMKAQLNRAHDSALNCAIARSKDGSTGYLLLDHTKPAKALEQALAAKFKDAVDARRGTAAIAPDDDATLVFRLNRPAPGIAPRLLKIIKPVGYAHLRLEYEDGSAAEQAAEEAVGEQTPPPAAIQPDAASVRARLTELVKGLPAVLAADPGRKQALLGLAQQAQAALAAGDAAAAHAATGQLAEALAASPGAVAAADAAAADGTVIYAKSRLAWLAARQRMQAQLTALAAALVAYFDDVPEMAGELGAAADERLAPVLAAMDEELADALDAAHDATDPAIRAAKVAQARAAIARYQAFLAGDATVAELDANPFVPVTLRAGLGGTLHTLSAALR